MLVIDNLPEGSFTLEIRNTCAPEKNTQLSGLYTSGGGFFTQCEAEGFRRITFFLDRPDVMAEYSVLIRANKAAYPVLLSNGNLVEEGDARQRPPLRPLARPVPQAELPVRAGRGPPGGARAADRARARARTTCSRSRCARGDLDKTEQAMNSLVASVVWDEARFGLPLDLERFMIVAVGDFNMGAMENKGLNLFNTKYVLANPATATDDDYAAIESVVGHEYFHNWTGNRITCRDWFQLSLKEGLTVFRDQEFSMDMVGQPDRARRPRIEDGARPAPVAVPRGRRARWRTRCGPTATSRSTTSTPSTIYEKGAEVVRMMQTLVGREGFERGITLYFQRHDGQAVTCDDFAQAIADANPGSELAERLPQFKRWYGQAGTPRLAARGRYDAPSRTFTLGLEQSAAPTAGAAAREPFVIPLAIGLLARDGREMALRLEDEPESAAATNRMLVLDDTKAFFTFVDVDEPPVLSLLRGFSAPVSLVDGLGDAELADPAAPRQRSVQPLGSRPAAGPEPAARRGRRRRRGAARRGLRRGDARAAAPARRSTRRSRRWR